MDQRQAEDPPTEPEPGKEKHETAEQDPESQLCLLPRMNLNSLSKIYLPASSVREVLGTVECVFIGQGLLVGGICSSSI